MILLCNTFITETPPSIGKGKVDRGLLKSSSNFDIFKYSLASLASAYKWKKAIIYFTLDSIYSNRENELIDFITKEFKDTELVLRTHRNEYQNDWKETYNLLNDELIWFYCNHDHIFMDSSRQNLEQCVTSFETNEKGTCCAMSFSHWPETMRTLHNFTNPGYEEHYCFNYSKNHDSIQIITKELYRNWWFEGEFNQYKFPRPDYFGLSLMEIKPVPFHKTLHPYREICRHFDGYQHVNPPITNYQCPALEIPDGFFENNIRIRFGYNDNVDGWTNINPLSEFYTAVDREKGTDYKLTYKDIPLFWTGRISEVDINTSLEDQDCITGRLTAVLSMLYTSEQFIISDELYEKVLQAYIIDYPNYMLGE